MADNRSNADEASTSNPQGQPADASANQPGAASEQAADQTQTGAADSGPAKAGKSAEPTKSSAKPPAKGATKSTAKRSTKRSPKAQAKAPAKAPAKAAETAPAKRTDQPSAAPPPAAEAEKAAKTPRRTTRKAAEPPAKAEPPAPPTPPAEVVPPAPATTTPALRDLDQAVGPTTPGVWAAAAWDALQHLDQPPQRLAELAVAEAGPRAAAWAGWLRATYPGAPAYGIARLATRQAVRSGWALALVEVGGPMMTPLRLPAAAWIRATVVLRVAAAYGHDPTDPARARDLIELLDLDPAAHDEPLPIGGLGGVASAASGLGLSRFLVSRLGLRRTPAAGVARALSAASDQGDRLERLGHRAVRHFRRAR